MVNKTTVIMPVYNGEKHIGASIESVLNQSVSCNLIIIDDGSTDNTEAVCRFYEQKYDVIQYIKTSNSGVASARNTGIKKARTKYVSFLDSDDFYDTRFIEKMQKKVSLNQSDACYCGNYDIVKGLKESKKKKFVSHNVFESYIKNKINPNTNNWIISREFLINNDILFNPKAFQGEDILFFGTLLLYTDKVTFIPELLTTYVTDTEGSLSKKINRKINSDIYWCNELALNINNSKLDKPKKNKYKNLVYKYRLSVGIVNTVNTMNVSTQEKQRILNKYKQYIDIYNISNGLRSIKGILIYLNIILRN